MNDALTLKSLSVSMRFSHIVPMCEEYVPDAAPFLECLCEVWKKFGRVDEPVAFRVHNEITVTSKRIWRVKAAVVYLTFDWKRKIMNHIFAVVGPSSADGTGWTC